MCTDGVWQEWADVCVGPDAGVCDGTPRLDCPCDTPGEVICRVPGPELYCQSDVGSASADGPCPGLDAGALTDAGLDAGSVTDAGSVADAGTDAGPPDAGTPAAGTPAMATYCVDIDVANDCTMSVSPEEITIPAGQTAYFCWRNRSRDYPIEVWLSYGGGYTDLAPGATWNEPIGHCLGPTARTEYADISTACSEHRFLIRCL